MQGEDAAGVGQEHLALLRQGNALWVAQEEARADLVLQTFDVEAHGRLREVHLARGFGEAPGVADGDEGSEEDRVVEHEPR